MKQTEELKVLKNTLLSIFGNVGKSYFQFKRFNNSSYFTFSSLRI